MPAHRTLDDWYTRPIFGVRCLVGVDRATWQHVVDRIIWQSAGSVLNARLQREPTYLYVCENGTYLCGEQAPDPFWTELREWGEARYPSHC